MTVIVHPDGSRWAAWHRNGSNLVTPARAIAGSITLQSVRMRLSLVDIDANVWFSEADDVHGVTDG